MRRFCAGVLWVALVLVVSALTWAVGIESWADDWGATRAEIAKSLPGDDLIEDPVTVTTRAVEIAVPPELVWPWIAQFGQGRGGLYSYDWLENIFGSGIHSTDRILGELQQVEVGDRVWITQPGHPADLGHVVAAAVPPNILVTAQSTPDRPAAPEDAPWTWAFVVEGNGEGGSRLISRNRFQSEGTVTDFVMDRVVGPVGFAMERRTLLGIAERAHRTAGLPTPPTWREPLWFAALLVTGAALVWLLSTRTPPARKAVFATLVTMAATLNLLRFPSATAAVALALVSVGLSALLHQAWGGPLGRRRSTAPTAADRPPSRQLEPAP